MHMPKTQHSLFGHNINWENGMQKHTYAEPYFNRWCRLLKTVYIWPIWQRNVKHIFNTRKRSFIHTNSKLHPRIHFSFAHKLRMKMIMSCTIWNYFILTDCQIKDGKEEYILILTCLCTCGCVCIYIYIYIYKINKYDINNWQHIMLMY